MKAGGGGRLLRVRRRGDRCRCAYRSLRMGFIWCVGFALGAVVSGCAVVAPVDTNAGRLRGATSFVGTIIHVNVHHRYVIIQSRVLLHPGDEANVYAGQQRVGRVRASVSRRSPFVVADIVEGRPEVGHVVRSNEQRNSEGME